MDLKSILTGSEDALPTLSQNLSTGTVAAPELPTISASASTYWKLGGSIVMSVAGMLLLGYGKKNADVQKIVLGLVLTIGSMFLF